MSKPVTTYLLLAFTITWTIAFTGFGCYRHHQISKLQLDILHSLAAIGPALAAALCVRWYYPGQGWKKLVQHCRPRLVSRSALWITFSPALLFVAGLLTYPLFKGHAYAFQETKRAFQLDSPAAYIGWALPFVTYALFEEIGWRGFLLPHLQQRYSALASTVVLSVIWTLWHAPFFCYRFEFSVLISIGFFFSLFVGALILTSLFNSTGGSIWATMAFHLLNNLASAFDQTYIVAIVSTGFVLLAIYLIVRLRPANLARVPRVGNYFLRS